MTNQQQQQPGTSGQQQAVGQAFQEQAIKQKNVKDIIGNPSQTIRRIIF